MLDLSGVVQIAAGDSSGYALKSDGTVWAWGDNTYGQLGTGTPLQLDAGAGAGLSGVKAISAGLGYYALAIKTDGTLWGWGRNASHELGDGTTTNHTSPIRIGA